MSSSSDFELIHGQLHVTKDASKPEALGKQLSSINGSAYLQGPVQFGNDKTFHPDVVPPLTAPIPKPEATVMIGPLKNSDSPLPTVCDNIKFVEKWQISPCGSTGIGAEKYEEKLANPYSLVVRSGEHETKKQQCGKEGINPNKTKGPAAAMFIGDVDIYGYTRIEDKLSVIGKADFYNSIVIRQNTLIGSDIDIGGNLCADGNGYFDGTLDGTPTGKLLDRILLADARPKPFDMVHPSLGEGNRLRYACIEGPEVGVYFRGRLKNKTEIELPWYWKDLIHFESITVQLQSIGAHQDIIVKRWDSEKIYLQSKGGMPIDCFYHVYAERKDVNALVVEYVGNEHTDYPDSDYNDPQFANRINTRTA